MICEPKGNQKGYGSDVLFWDGNWNGGTHTNVTALDLSVNSFLDYLELCIKNVLMSCQKSKCEQTILFLHLWVNKIDRI